MLDLEPLPTHACLQAAEHFCVGTKTTVGHSCKETQPALNCSVASMTDTCEAAKAAGNAAWSVGNVDEALRCFT
eukprot:1321-Heterococcus_DN1.PRE.4